MIRLNKLTLFYKAIAVALVCAALIALTGCRANRDGAVALAGAAEAGEKDGIVIKVAVPLDYAKQNTGFLQGVELAKQDIAKLNAKPSIAVEIDDDKGSFSKAVVLAQDYVADPSVVGVVGHWYSDICGSVADLYNRGGKTLIIPTVSMIGLVSGDTPFVFQNIPNDRQIGKALCDYAKKHGADSIVIYYEKSSYGFTMAQEVEKTCRSLGISVVDRASGLVLERDLANTKRKWDAADYQAVILICNVEEGAAFVNRLRALGSDALILCSDGMDSGSLIDLLHGDPGELYVASINNTDTQDERLLAFRKRFEDSFGTQPDVWALQGYDCVMLIAHAVDEHRVTNSQELKEYLQSATQIDSVFGALRFNETHEVEGKSIYLLKVSASGMKVVKGGEENSDAAE